MTMPNPFSDVFSPAGHTPTPANPFSELFDPTSAAPPAAMSSDMGTPPIAATSMSLAPSFRTPRFDVNQPAPRGPSFAGGALPLLAAVLAGGKSPAAIGAGLAAYMHGKRLRESERIEATELARKHQAESAEFYSRAVAQAQTIDDAITLEQWREAIAPMARLHGIDPRVFTLNSQRVAARAQREATALLEALDKEHPDGNYSIPIDRLEKITGKKYEGPSSRGLVPRSVLAKVAGRDAFDAQAQPLAPSVKPLPGTTPNSPIEAQIADAIEVEEKRLGRKLTADERMKVRTGAASTYQGIVGRSDDRPRVDGLTQNQRLNAIRGYQRDWNRALQPVIERQQQVAKLDSGLASLERGERPAATEIIVIAFEKMQDETSVVREAEYGRPGEMQSLRDRISAALAKLRSGGSNLTDDNLRALAKEGKALAAALDQVSIRQLQDYRQGIEETLDDAGIQHSRVFGQSGIGRREGSAPAPTTAKPTGRFNPATGKVETVP